jgi:hypothetical protein
MLDFMDEPSLIPPRDRLLARIATLNNIAVIGIAGWLALASIPVREQGVHAGLPPVSSMESPEIAYGGTATVMLQIPGGLPTASGGIGSGSGDF